MPTGAERSEAEWRYVGLTDFGAMMIAPGRGGAWGGTMISETGRVLAICDSNWPREDRRRSVCRLR